jgi:hypothetical protein
MNTLKPALTTVLMVGAATATAAEFKLNDDLTVTANVVATAGTIIRTEQPSPSTYAFVPSVALAGAKPGGLVGQTGGSDLNFKRGDLTSTVLKTMIDLDIRQRDSGLFLRLDGWKDLVLGRRGVAYGNNPNGFTPSAPLSDQGFAPDAKFSNVRVRDVYAYTRFGGAADAHTDVRIGRQVLNWGVSQFFTGGLGAVSNPYDTAAQLRPGALPQESRVPIGMVSINAALSKTLAFEAYVPFEFRPSNVPGCGTFFDVASVTPQGCNVVGPFAGTVPGTPLNTVESLTERSLLNSGYYLHRQDESMPGGGGQFGLSLRYRHSAWNTEFRAYAARSDNTLRNIYSVTIENINGGTLPAGIAGALRRLIDPNGLKYGIVYPKGIHTYGVSFDTRLANNGRVFGELAYRPDQAIGYSPIDLLLAGFSRSPTSLLQEQKGFLSLPAGAVFEGYDRHPLLTANLGGNKVLANAWGADRVVLAAEVGWSHLNGLPDPAVFRYGRGLAYGGAPYYLGGALTACAVTMPGLNGVPGKTCTYDGYISTNAWGLRGRIATTYNAALAGADLTPSLTLAKDIKGYSHDATFSEGRQTVRLALRADWGKRYFLEGAYTNFSGGRYNLLADRSNLALVAGASF